MCIYRIIQLSIRGKQKGASNLLDKHKPRLKIATPNMAVKLLLTIGAAAWYMVQVAAAEAADNQDDPNNMADLISLITAIHAESRPEVFFMSSRSLIFAKSVDLEHDAVHDLLLSRKVGRRCLKWSAK